MASVPVSLPAGALTPAIETFDRRVPMLLIAGAAYQILLAASEGLFQFQLLFATLPVIGLGLLAALGAPCDVRMRPSILTGLGLVLLFGQAAVLVATTHYYYYKPATRTGDVLPLVVVFVGSAVAILLSRDRRALFVAVLAHVAAGWWVIAHSHNPKIDVWLFHQDSAAALLRGENPFAITFPNVYGHKNRFYSDDIQVDGRVMFGFPYPPLSLFLYLPSYVLTSESRYAHAMAYALCGLGMALVSRGRVAVIAAALFLAAPACFIVIENAWTEPFVFLMLVLVALAAIHAPRWLPVALGLFFAIKQYNVIFVPLLFLLLPRPLAWGSSLRFLGWMMLTGAVVSLPLAMWDWPAFWNSNVTIQVKQPFRYDALSFLALIANLQPGTFEPPRWWSAIPFAMVAPTLALVLWRVPRDIGGFVLGVAAVTIVFLFSNRQSFLNYHTFAAGSLLLTAALMGKPAPDRDTARLA